MSVIENPDYKAALKTILDRAESDEAFRVRVLSDAPAAIKEATGLDVPESVTVKFVEYGQAGSLQLVVPLLPRSSDELSGEELDKIAGGWMFPYNM